MRGYNILGIFIVISVCIVPCLLQTPGVPLNSYPNYRERTSVVLVNFVRMSPYGYKSMFLPSANILNSSNHPPVPPLRYNYDLNRSSRYHSTELATVAGCPFGHNSCNGATFATRLRWFYTLATYWGENLQAGASDPAGAVKSLVYDGGAADLTHAAMHRTIMMSKTYTCLGVGYAYGSNYYRHYWTQDFANNCATPSNPILAGTHTTFFSGQTMFLVNFFTFANPTLKPRSATVVINNVSYPLSLAQAYSYNYASAQGTWMASFARASGCRQYYFRFVDYNGITWRYPQTGSFYTFGEGACTSDYSSV